MKKRFLCNWKNDLSSRRLNFFPYLILLLLCTLMKRVNQCYCIVTCNQYLNWCSFWLYVRNPFEKETRYHKLDSMSYNLLYSEVVYWKENPTEHKTTFDSLIYSVSVFYDRASGTHLGKNWDIESDHFRD